MAESHSTETTQTNTEPSGPAGIGGWLILLAIEEVLAPLSLAWKLITTHTTENAQQAFEAIPVAMFGSLAINVVYVSFWFVTAFTFFARKRVFTTMFTAQTVAILLYQAVESAWISATMGAPVDRLITPDAIVRSGVAFAISLIWLAYLWRSRRALNTFVY